jgi:hypothetical protein
VTAPWQLAGWCYQRGQERIGPVPTEEVVRLLNSNELHLEDEVWAVWHVSGQTLLMRSRAIAARDVESEHVA